MDYLDITSRFTEQSIKRITTSIKILRFIFIFSLCIIIYDGYIIYHQPNVFISICFGIISCNMGWLFTELSSNKYDLKLEKEYLNNIKKCRTDMDSVGAAKQLDAAIKYYEDAKRSLGVLNFACPENKPQESESPVVEK